MTAGYLFELLFYHGTSLYPRFQSANLILDLTLPLCQIGNVQFILTEFRAELLDLRRHDRRGLRGAALLSGLRRLCNVLFQLVDLRLQLDHVGMLGSVASEQLRQFVLEGIELLVGGFEICTRS